MDTRTFQPSEAAADLNLYFDSHDKQICDSSLKGFGIFVDFQTDGPGLTIIPSFIHGRQEFEDFTDVAAVIVTQHPQIRNMLSVIVGKSMALEAMGKLYADDTND